MKKYYLIFYIYILHSITYGINVTDSLNLLLNKTENSIQKINLHLEIANQLMYDDFSLSKSHLEKALPLAIKLKNDTLNIKIYNSFGDIYYLNNNIDSSKKYYTIALEYSERIKNTYLMASSFAGLGLVSESRNDYSNALKYYINAYNIYEKLNDLKQISNMLNNIGMLYYAQDDFKNCTTYLLKCLEIDEKLGNIPGQGYSLTNLGMIYYQTNEYEKALEFLERALIIRENLGQVSKIAVTSNNIANVCIELKDYNKALKLYLKALEIHRKQENSYQIGLVLNNLGQFFNNNLKSPEKSIIYLEEAKNIFELQGSVPNLKNTYSYLAESYYTIGNLEKAYYYQSKYIEAKDSLYIISKNEKVAELATKFNTERNEKQLQIQQLQLGQQKAQIENHKLQQYFYIVGGIGILIILIITIFSLLQKKKDNKLLEVQKHFISEKNEELNQQNEEIIAISEQVEKQNFILSKQNNNILSSISYAKRIQEAILPSDEFIKQCLPNSFVLFKPKDIVSGDFYWMEKVNNKVIWAVVDCTGHGVPGAFMSILGANGLKKIVLERNILKPSEILNQLTEHVISSIKSTTDGEEVKDGMDIALCALNLDTYTLEYSGAYNPLYIIRNRTSTIEQIKATKRPIGRFKRNNIPSFENHTIQLQKGDLIYTFSDGYADQFGGENGLKLTPKKFREIIEENSTKPLFEQKNNLNSKLVEWQGKEEQLDDICIIGVKL